MSLQTICRLKSTCSNTNTNNKKHQLLKTDKIRQFQNETKGPNPGFPISHLPLELQHEIYTHYFRTLPPIAITPSNLHPGTLTPPLLLSSPFFIYATSPDLVYTHTTFVFPTPSLLSSFALSSPYAQQTRHVRITHGDVGKEGPDWVYALHSCLPGLESVVFVMGRSGLERAGVERFGVWWRCVVGAMREGVLAEGDVVGRGGKRGDRGMLLGVEDEEGMVVVSEWIGGLENSNDGENCF